MSPAALLAAICVPLVLWNPKDSKVGYRPPKWLALVGLATLAVLMVEYAAIEMAFLFFFRVPPTAGRVLPIDFPGVGVLVVLIGVPELSSLRFSTIARTGIYLLFAVSLFSSPNFLQAERDLRGPARAWHRANVARLVKTGGAVEFDPLPPRPVSFRESGLSWRSGCWVNQCMAVDLGAQSVSLKGPKENHWDGGNPCDPDPLVP